MSEKGCSDCAHEAFDPIGVCGTGQPSGEMACAICIRHPEADELYNNIKNLFKWWNIRARFFIWRTFRRSKCKDMYITLKESLKK